MTKNAPCPDRRLSLSKKQNKGMVIAPCICIANARSAIKTEERALRKQNSARLSLFCFFAVIFLLRKSDIEAYGFSGILFTIKNIT